MERYVKLRLERSCCDVLNSVELSVHPDLTIEFIKEHPEIHWNFHNMILLPQFHISWIAEFPSVYWNWNELSRIIPFKHIIKYRHFPWNWSIVAEGLTLDQIIEYPGIPWNFSRLHMNRIEKRDLKFFRFYRQHIPSWKWAHFARVLTWDAFRESTDLPWVRDIDMISCEETFQRCDIHIIRDHVLFCNWVNLTIFVHIDIINDHPELPWRKEHIHWNRTTWKTRSVPFQQSIREWHASNTIKRAWKTAVSNPQFALCRNRLLREFKEMET